MHMHAALPSHLGMTHALYTSPNKQLLLHLWHTCS